MTNLELETINLLVGAKVKYHGNNAYIIAFNREKNTFVLDVETNYDTIGEPQIVEIDRTKLLSEYSVEIHGKIKRKIEQNLKTLGRLK